MELVRCPCGDTEDDGLMICCESCNTWQHALCFLINSEDRVPEKHICNLCDKELQKDTSAEDLKSLCLKRRVVGACNESSSFSVQGISNKLGCDLPTAKRVLESLFEDGLVVVKGNKTKRWFVKKQKFSSQDVPGRTTDGSPKEKKFFLWDL